MSRFRGRAPLLIRLPEEFLLLRNRHFFVADVIIFLTAPLLALVLRTDATSSIGVYWYALVLYTAMALAVHVGVFYKMDLYRRFWRYASVSEYSVIVLAGALSTLIIVVLVLGGRWLWVELQLTPSMTLLPRSIPFIEGMLVVLLVAGNRVSVRLVELSLRRRPRERGERIVIMGAGTTGAMIVREIMQNTQVDLHVVAFLDDDVAKHGVRIHGISVLGDRNLIPRLARKGVISQVVIAMPSAPGREIRQIVELCAKVNIKAKTVPGMYELLDNRVSVSQVRNIEIEDLLRRHPVQTDVTAVTALLRGRRVLVTGGGGSIGSELCRQILRCGPAALIMVGHGENSIFEIYHELQRSMAENWGRDPLTSATLLCPVIADTRHTKRLARVFEEHRPEIVFHAAAHKHVPLMEANPCEAISNNVLGTQTVVEAALAANVERLVMISSDKAVNPSSIMGASKRAAELVVHDAAVRSGKAFMAVRFGNVLGSRGSVVPIFRRQIAAGGPVTVTHPEMTRYFMTIPEAVQLVLQAAELGHGGEVFLLDMGEPVKIIDLAREMIRLSGLEVDRDIDITYSGLRPGEKLYEELFVDGEENEHTRHEKVFIAQNASQLVPDGLEKSLQVLYAAAEENDREAIVGGLQRMVSEFRRTGSEKVQTEPAIQQPSTVLTKRSTSANGTAGDDEGVTLQARGS